jgi:hypothetical protein
MVSPRDRCWPPGRLKPAACHHSPRHAALSRATSPLSRRSSSAFLVASAASTTSWRVMSRAWSASPRCTGKRDRLKRLILGISDPNSFSTSLDGFHAAINSHEFNPGYRYLDHDRPVSSLRRCWSGRRRSWGEAGQSRRCGRRVDALSADAERAEKQADAAEADRRVAEVRA